VSFDNISEIMPELSPTSKKFQDFLISRGFRNKLVEFPEGTKTSADAAMAIGCKIEQIAKSIVFIGKNSRQPILVIASGPNRINEKKIQALISEPVEKADASFVREQSGYSIGGVPPTGHNKKLKIFIDEDLMKLGEMWSAGGTPNTVFKLTTNELLEMTHGQVINIK
jgi:prolyl-tRNA editing enzyme YbaK/EbsC (Cys-tRNA(Pro) deacylase)